MNLKNIRGTILHNLFLDEQVDKFYRNFQKQYPNFTRENRLKAVWYILRLNYAQYRRKPLNRVNLPKNLVPVKQKASNFKYYLSGDKRKDFDEIINTIKDYDIISFDIFDTALYRKVEFPNDVFKIMASEMKYSDFLYVRKKAEAEARTRMEKLEGHREIQLSDIYDVLSERYGVKKEWQYRECELEIELSVTNSFIYKIYREALALGKKVIFISDMYLPQETIVSMLHKNGYDSYHHLYLSNEYKLRKGDGKLQKFVLEQHNDEKILHIGDNYDADVKKSIEAGFAAIHNPDSHLIFRESDMDNFAGSFYRALIQHSLNNGLWDQNLYFEHGFRVGGILAAGFCEHINKIVKEKHIDKILFCSRDCNVIHKIYNQYYKECDNEYIKISRCAIMSVCMERYLYDYINRFVIRHANQVGNTKTVAEILKETGLSYLIDFLEDADIDKFLYYSSVNKKKFEDFLFEHLETIKKYQEEYLEAAKEYFSEIINQAKNILIVDIGWTGTGIVALKYFLEEHFEEKLENIYGELMCTSRNEALTNSISDSTISSFVYSPYDNMDLTRFMMPAKVSTKTADLLHMPLEFLFTSTEPSLVNYSYSEDKITFEYAKNNPQNINEIEEMQQGMMKFVEMYQEYRDKFKNISPISSYVAFNPLREAIRHKEYCYNVYKNFTYDAMSTPFVDNTMVEKFENLFDKQSEIYVNGKNKILFITPELIYTGAPRSLLRMCNVAKNLGYTPEVWSAKNGPFIQEYINNGILVKIVPEKQLYSKEIKNLLKDFNMAVCNTIVTNEYAKVLGRYMPVVWYIREATNVMDFCRNNPERLYMLQNSKDIYCVSDYAAKALNKYNKHGVHVLHNCVEDETDLAINYKCGTGEKVKFVQFGTMEYRKGYDVLIAAYEALPEKYKEQVELYFAGGFINSGTPYCSYIFEKINKNNNIHYLGVVKGEKNKIETLSQMDVVVVASRDESCSLVALEGAMLSKPLIVTENVGAKYIINESNGLIAETGDVESLKQCLIYMVDNKADLQKMGDESRKQYEKYAGMDAYTENLKKLYDKSREKEKLEFKIKRLHNIWQYSYKRRQLKKKIDELTSIKNTKKKEQVFVSLTSYPGRIGTVHTCIKSLLNQSVTPYKIILWLSKMEFPNLEEDLPEELLSLRNEIFQIRWTDDDLKPHKKYYYAMQEYKDFPIIIVDDDVIYNSKLVELLMDSYKKFPKNISCMRANLMLFKDDKSLRKYDSWVYDYKMLRDTPSYQLLPTGVGGVLYPPNIFKDDLFDKDAIIKTSLYCDDLWLKINAVYSGISVIVPKDSVSYKEIPSTQECALWRLNIGRNNNDLSLENILNYFDEKYKNSNEILNIMRKDRFC